MVIAGQPTWRCSGNILRGTFHTKHIPVANSESITVITATGIDWYSSFLFFLSFFFFFWDGALSKCCFYFLVEPNLPWNISFSCFRSYISKVFQQWVDASVLCLVFFVTNSRNRVELRMMEKAVITITPRKFLEWKHTLRLSWWGFQGTSFIHKARQLVTILTVGYRGGWNVMNNLQVSVTPASMRFESGIPVKGTWMSSKNLFRASGPPCFGKRNGLVASLLRNSLLCCSTINWTWQTTERRFCVKAMQQGDRGPRNVWSFWKLSDFHPNSFFTPPQSPVKARKVPPGMPSPTQLVRSTWPLWPNIWRGGKDFATLHLLSSFYPVHSYKFALCAPHFFNFPWPNTRKKHLAVALFTQKDNAPCIGFPCIRTVCKAVAPNVPRVLPPVSLRTTGNQWPPEKERWWYFSTSCSFLQKRVETVTTGIHF